MTLSPLTTCQTMVKVLVGSLAQGLVGLKSDDDFLIRIRTACEGMNV
ncbi:MAG: hypothetical protein EWM73_01350 [Nitrospira sp.]|nr:MAG: hypothetical protein EWM73_01350 [Nitrospira sp.]